MTMPIQASTGSPMSGSLANGTYETFGGIDIRGDEDSTFFSEHTVYSQVKIIDQYYDYFLSKSKIFIIISIFDRKFLYLSIFF